MSSLKEWFQILLPLIIFLGLFLLRYVSQFFKAGRLKEIAPYLNGEAVIWPFSPPKIRGTYMGIPFQIIFMAAGRSSPGRMVIKLSFAFPFEMEVRGHGAMQGLEQLFQSGKPIETGDEGFDEAVLVRANRAHDKAELFLDNPVNRESILEVFREGFENIRFTEEELILSRRGDFLGGELTAEHSLRDLALATRLMQRL